MVLQPQQFARRDGAALHLREDAIRLNWIFDDLASADGHVVRVRFSCSARIADTDADRRMFGEVFLGSSSLVSASDVTDHFAARLRAAAAQATARFTAEQCIAQKSSDVQTALVAACNPIAFACGIEILPPFQLEMTSPSLDRARIESLHRARAEQRAAGQVQHLQRANELLKEFHDLRRQMPQLTPGQILQHINPMDRGSTLQSLLMASASADQSHALWAVAGPLLVKIDPARSPPRTELIPLPTIAGPLRSVQVGTIHGRRLLLIGARSGVMIVPPDSPAEAEIYLDPTVQSQLGFNRVVARGEQIFASHGEAGVVGWSLGKTAQPIVRYSANPAAATELQGEIASPGPVSAGASPSLLKAGGPARPSGPRNLQLLGADHLLYSVGSDLMLLGATDPIVLPGESKSDIVAIVPDECRMLIVHADSTVAVFSAESRTIIDCQRRAGRVAAAGALPWLSGVRLLLVDADGPIDCVGFDDPLITQYVSSHRGLRAITACPQFVAALSGDRQRVIIWQSWDGSAPHVEAHITALVRHRVADVEFG